MRTSQLPFEKVGECLCRYTSNSVHYARFESHGKEIRRSLGTTDKVAARHKLGDLQKDLARVDLTAGRFSLAEMCDRYLETVQNQKPKTLRRKRDIAARLKAGFPGGAGGIHRQGYPFQGLGMAGQLRLRAVSFNLYLEFVRAVLALAVEDRLIPAPPMST